MEQVYHLELQLLCVAVQITFLLDGKSSPDKFKWRSIVFNSSFLYYYRYILIMSFFHFSEFVVTSVIRPQNLSSESFLLNHSKAYGIAALISWIEYWTEFWLFPGITDFKCTKQYLYLIFLNNFQNSTTQVIKMPIGLV